MPNENVQAVSIIDAKAALRYIKDKDYIRFYCANPRQQVWLDIYDLD